MARCLQKAWELEPNPITCHAMMAVALGAPQGDSTTELRLWFDRGISLESDYLPVYESFLYSLKPRWYGSHRAQLALGEQCLATGRFDTNVPLFLLRCVRDIATETREIPDLYRQKEIGDKLDAMIDGYIAAEKTPKPKTYYQTYKLYFYYQRGF